MPARAFVTSLLIVFHLIAISLAAIPDRTADPSVEPPPRLDTDPVAIALTPAVRQLARQLASTETMLLQWARPVQAVTQRYVDIGLPQSWNMFSEPTTNSRFVRFDWYVRDRGNPGTVRVFRELVLPSLPEGQTRLWYSARDKAISVAVRSYLFVDDRDKSSGRSGDPALTRGPHIAPVVRYFHRRFLTARGLAAEQIVRTEIWRGVAPIPPPSDLSRPSNLEQRRQILAKYRDPQPTQVSSLVSSEMWTTYSEADIVWQLIYMNEQ